MIAPRPARRNPRGQQDHRLAVAASDGHPAFRRLLQRFEARTGVPLVVNTSFNVRGEPIVRTPEEAIDLYERTALDLLVIEDRVLTKR